MPEQEVMSILLEELLLWFLSQGGSIEQSGSPFKKSASQEDLDVLFEEITVFRK